METKLRQLNSADSNFDIELDQLLNRDAAGDSAAQKISNWVSDTINEVRTKGDTALYELTEKFDQFDVHSEGIEIAPERLTQALESIPSELRQSLEYAAERINDYHQHQLQQSWSYEQADGSILGQKVTPIERVGLYVPGGKAVYPSSVLMNAIPAKVAGVKEIVMVSPTPNGQINEVVLAAAKIVGIDRVLRIGGAQAIAALAYGTESIGAVDKITGPGNAYVAEAKKQVFGRVGIDMIAGPSEVLVIADDSANPDWVAMDMFAQAEHDESAQSLFLTQSVEQAKRVQQSIDALLADMPRKDIIAKSLANNGAIIVASNRDELIDIANKIAPEHLEVFTQDAQALAEQISHAGAIFIGQNSAESLGDYCAGPNHVLPTSGTARFSSPLGVYDFQKRTSMIQISEGGAQEIGKHAAILAHSESLTGHARSAEYRVKS